MSYRLKLEQNCRHKMLPSAMSDSEQTLIRYGNEPLTYTRNSIIKHIVLSPLSPATLRPELGSWPPIFGVSKEFRFYEVVLSVLRPTLSHAGGSMVCFYVWFLSTNLPGSGRPTSSYTTATIAWWIIETQTPLPLVKALHPLGGHTYFSSIIMCPSLNLGISSPKLLDNWYYFRIPGLKRPRREADHSSPSSVQDKNEDSYTSTPAI
jgi:hypothetical protein